MMWNRCSFGRYILWSGRTLDLLRATCVSKCVYVMCSCYMVTWSTTKSSTLPNSETNNATSHFWIGKHHTKSERRTSIDKERNAFCAQIDVARMRDLFFPGIFRRHWQRVNIWQTSNLQIYRASYTMDLKSVVLVFDNIITVNIWSLEDRKKNSFISLQ